MMYVYGEIVKPAHTILPICSEQMRGIMSALLHPLILLAIILVGYIFKRTHIFGQRDYRVIQRIVFNLTLPCAIIVSFATREHDNALLWISLFGLFCGFLPTPFLFWISRKRPVRERAFLMLNGAGFNIGNFCFPVMQGLLGPASLVPGAMFDVGNCVVVSAGNNLLTQRLLHIDPDRPLYEQNPGSAPTLPYHKPTDPDARRLARRATLRGIAKGFFTSVPFDTYIIMIVLMLANVHLPQWIPQVLDPVAQANGFCSMLMVGMLMELPSTKLETTEVLRVVLLRIPFAILFALISWYIMPFDDLTRKALVMLSLAPTSVFGTLFSDRVLDNARMAGFCMSITAIIGLAAMTGVNILL